MSSSPSNTLEKQRSSQETIRRARSQDHIEVTKSQEVSYPAVSQTSSTTFSTTTSIKRPRKASTSSDSDPTPEDTQMPSTTSSSSKSHDSGSKKHSSSSSSSKSKSKQKKSDNWTEVAEPEERRRIQNRLAQRKFREKAKEQKEKSERDERNQELAGSSYTVPAPDQLQDDDGECSGLPWGSISMRHVVSHGQGSSRSRRSAGDGDDDYVAGDDAYGQYYNTVAYDTTQEQQTSYSSYQSYASYDNSSGVGAGDFFDDGAYYYNTDLDGSQ